VALGSTHHLTHHFVCGEVGFRAVPSWRECRQGACGTAHSAGNNTKLGHADELDHSRLSRSMLFCRIVVIGLTLALSACAPDFDFKKDFLCRPDGHCVNASPGHTGIGI